MPEPQIQLHQARNMTAKINSYDQHLNTCRHFENFVGGSNARGLNFQNTGDYYFAIEIPVELVREHLNKKTEELKQELRTLGVNVS